MVLVSMRTRVAVWTRDQGICGICGQAVTVADFELDHILPQCDGGDNAIDNLRVAHRICNRHRVDFRRANLRRPRVVQPCSICGKEMPPSYETRLYCGATCRKRAERRRRPPPAASGDHHG